MAAGLSFFSKKNQLRAAGDPEDEKEKTGSVASYLRAPVHFELGPLAVPVIRDSRAERHVILRIDLELTDWATGQETSRRSTKLHDAYINGLYDYYSCVTPGAQTVNAVAPNKRLMRETERMPGKGLVKKISIKGAI